MNGTERSLFGTVAKKGLALALVLCLLACATIAVGASAPGVAAQPLSEASSAAGAEIVLATPSGTPGVAGASDPAALRANLYNVYGRWYDTASEALAESGIGPTDLRAARVFALLGAAQTTAADVCWATLSDNGAMSEAILNRCVGGASLRILERLFPGSGQPAIIVFEHVIPSQIAEGAEVPYDMVAASVLGRLVANEVMAANPALMQ